MSQVFADIILPLAFGGEVFTYGCSAVVSVGCRVEVPLGRSKVLVGIVANVHERAPTKYKDILSVLDQRPIMSVAQVELMRWIASYYLCPVGVVMKVLLPSGIHGGRYELPKRVGVELAREFDEVALCKLLEDLKRTKAQQKALLCFLEDGVAITDRRLLSKGASAVGISGLIKKGIFRRIEITTPIDGIQSGESQPISPLTESVIEAFERQNTVLLRERTLTSRGGMIRELVGWHRSRVGGQVLVLMADNYSCSGVCDMLGEGCVEYSTQVSAHGRSGVYMRMLDFASSVDVVVGTRGALLLPYEKLGLVIIVDEQDGGHKSSDSAPRLNGRDTALVLASKHGAKVLLTSVAPSLESMYNVHSGRWALVEQRVSGEASVKVLERGKELMSKYLRRRMGEVLQDWNQVALFQNRRGFAIYVECTECGHIPSCPNCSSMLTYHQQSATLECHHCQWATTEIGGCVKCGSTPLQPQGYGTERVEQNIKELFQNMTIARVDRDTVQDMESREVTADIVVGTQMLLGSVHMAKLGMVGVLNADNMFATSDFRTSERALGMLLRLRSLLPSWGELVVQTSQLQSPVVKALEWDEVDKFLQGELMQRHDLGYPPFSRAIVLRLAYGEREDLHRVSCDLDGVLRSIFGNSLSAPYEPLVERVRGEWLLEFFLRLPRAGDLASSKEKLSAEVLKFRRSHPRVGLTIDVDPQ